MEIDKIGLGGGCHWCTEAVFLALRGVEKVEQGWLSSQDQPDFLSEGVIVHFQEAVISLKILLHIHLLTHSSSSQHSMRSKYRSAIYVYTDQQEKQAKAIIQELQTGFPQPIITEVVQAYHFKGNEAQFLNYYFNDPQKPFCQTYIDPKIQLLIQQFGQVVDHEKLSHSSNLPH